MGRYLGAWIAARPADIDAGFGYWSRAGVAIFDVLDGEGERLAQELRKRKPGARYSHVDVSNEDNVRRAVGEAAAQFGRIDAVVNNAGIGGANKPTHELTEEERDRVQTMDYLEAPQ